MGGELTKKGDREGACGKGGGERWLVVERGGTVGRAEDYTGGRGAEQRIAREGEEEC